VRKSGYGHKKRGFTLLELVIATAIFVFTAAGILSLVISCIILNEINRNTLVAYTAIQSKMEEIKSQPFDGVNAYNGQIFDLSGFPVGDGKGMVTVNTINSNRLNITIDGCFKSYNRTTGNNISNCQSSPVELITEISR
jgi:type II secretory pathway pseudopilin PulG